MTFTNFIKRPVLSTVISIFLVLLGIIGLASLPIEQYPDIAPPTITVSTVYQGADAQTVLNSVVTPLEESINGVENMTYMSSTATNAGMAMITVYFKQGTDPNMCAVNVQNRVQQAQALLPAEVTRVGVTVSKRQSSNVIMYSLTTDDSRYDGQFLTNYNNINIIPLLKRINGVGDVQSPSMASYSMRIWLKPEKMKIYGLVPTDISGVLAEQNIEAAPGSLGENGSVAFEYALRYKGRLQKASEFENILIKSSTTGQTLRLKEIALILRAQNQIHEHQAQYEYQCGGVAAFRLRASQTGVFIAITGRQCVLRYFGNGLHRLTGRIAGSRRYADIDGCKEVEACDIGWAVDTLQGAKFRNRCHLSIARTHVDVTQLVGTETIIGACLNHNAEQFAVGVEV